MSKCHTAVDYARALKDLADIHFAHAKTIVLVQDNLSIHSKASLYEAFPAVEARRLKSVTGRWLHETSMVSRPCGLVLVQNRSLVQSRCQS